MNKRISITERDVLQVFINSLFAIGACFIMLFVVNVTPSEDDFIVLVSECGGTFDSAVNVPQHFNNLWSAKLWADGQMLIGAGDLARVYGQNESGSFGEINELILMRTSSDDCYAGEFRAWGQP